MKQLGKSTAVLASSSVLVQGITAVTYFLVARALMPEQFGLITGAVGIATLVLTALDFGINSLTVRQLARQPGDLRVFTSTLSSKILMSVIVGTLWIVGVLALGTLSPGWRDFWWLGPYIAFSDVASALTVLPKSREEMSRVAIVQMVQKVVCLLVALAFIPLGHAYEALLVGLPAGALISIVVCTRFVEAPYRQLSWPGLASIKDLWVASAGFGIAGFAAQLQRADVAIVGAAAGPAAAGLYAAPSRITNMVAVLPTALSVAILPRVARPGDAKAARRDSVLAVAVVVLLSGIGLLVVAVLAEPMVKLVLGNEYMGSVPVLRVFLIGVLVMCANAPIAALLQAEGKDALVAKVLGVSSIIGLVTVWIGALMGGAVGAATGYVALQIAILAPLAYQLRIPAESMIHVVSSTDGTR